MTWATPERRLRLTWELALISFLALGLYGLSWLALAFRGWRVAWECLSRGMTKSPLSLPSPHGWGEGWGEGRAHWSLAHWSLVILSRGSTFRS
jgi:hypothetical protein